MKIKDKYNLVTEGNRFIFVNNLTCITIKLLVSRF